MSAAACAALALSFGWRAGAGPPPPPARHDRELEELLSFEEKARAETDFAHAPPWHAISGADPFALARLPGSPELVGLLRGADAVVVLDEKVGERQRLAAPASPTGVAVRDDGEVLVSGEASSEVARYRWTEGKLVPAASITVPGVLGLRDVAVGGKTLYAADEIGGRLLALDLDGGEGPPRPLAACQGAIEVVSASPYVVGNCLLDHALVVLRDGREIARIVHDGPFWSVAANVAADGSLLIAAGGVEDHPLDRLDGAFGYIDSFVFVYRVADRATRLAEIDVSALGVVTPKWLALEPNGGAPLLRVAGYASDRLLALSFASERFDTAPEARSITIPPGTTSIAGNVAANPLLDAWVVLEETGTRILTVAPANPRSTESRVGEALFFTTAMSPWNSSGGKRSRFTCETCHFEGYVDGRTHYTGRADVHATTKPLRGLHGNRPYFSRALDPTMARMVHAEFRVANRLNGHDPWFALEKKDYAWLAGIDGLPETMTPEVLRRSLMHFLMDFGHDANPMTRGRTAWSLDEAHGASVFRDLCEGCHSARLVADDPSSRIPFERWEEMIFGSGTIVWGRLGYEKTGVTPYVYSEGARVPALRRLYKKRPYFTNGSAKSLDAVLESALVTEGGFLHSGTDPSGRKLGPEDRQALLAFLGLL